MSVKPESTFLRSVHRHLEGVHFEKMNNPYRSGTADVWYSGQYGDLWVEYKYVPKLPTHANVVPDLSPNQRRWLAERAAEGRRVEVVVGTKEGGAVLTPDEFLTGISPDVFRSRMLSRAALAERIRSITGPAACLSPSTYLRPPPLSQRCTKPLQPLSP